MWNCMDSESVHCCNAAAFATVNESHPKRLSSVHCINANEDNNRYNFVSMPIKNSLDVFQLHTLVFQLVNDSFTVLYASIKWIIKPIYLCLRFSLPLPPFFLSIFVVCMLQWNHWMHWYWFDQFVHVSVCASVREKPNNYNLNSNFESFVYLRLHFVMRAATGK